MIKAGIVGSAGVTAGELIRLMMHHADVDLIFAHSSSNAGKRLSDVHTDLVGESTMRFSDELNDNVDVVFFCVDHGQCSAYLRDNPWLLEKKIIDLSNEFRIASPSHDFVYGLPELHRPLIRRSKHVANPGCFATAIQLGALPLAHAGLLNSELHVQAMTGSTGAGRKLENTLHFSWRASNVQVYKPFVHQHLPEIRQSLRTLQPSFDTALNFIPMRGPFTRGIHASMYTSCSMDLAQLKQLYTNYFDPHPFVTIVDELPDLKSVVNTNKALLHISTHEGKVLVVSVIDNLLKGASGQALQNMNLMFDLPETRGLLLKASAF